MVEDDRARVLFITVEDESGIANAAPHDDIGGRRGRVQKVGAVIHVICERVVDYTDFLARVALAVPHPSHPVTVE